jgi:acyl-CoA thioesterase
MSEDSAASIEDARSLLAGDRLAQQLGIEIVEIGPGSAKTRLSLAPMHRNGVGIVHGGTIFALADVAFAAASNSRGQVALAIEAQISFLEPISEGVLTAEARETALGPRLGRYTIEVRDGDARLVALFHGTVYRKKTAVGALLAETRASAAMKGK